MGKDDLPYYVIKNTGAEIHDVSYSLDSWFEGTSYYSEMAAPVLCRFTALTRTDPIWYGRNIDTEFDEHSQTFSISIYRMFTGEPFTPYDIVAQAFKSGVLPPYSYYPQYLCVTAYYKNYRNESCQSDILICRRYIEAEATYGKEFSYFVGAKIEPSEAMLTIDLRGWADPLERLREAINAYWDNFEYPE
jgi:hypothetical protein